MGTRYRYVTPDGGPPGDGIPPGLEPPQGAVFGCPYPCNGPPPFFSGPFGPPMFAQPPPPAPNMMCFASQGPPPAGPGQTVCFQAPGPPPYTPNPWHTARPSVPSLANERPPSGAYVKGHIAKLDNGEAVIPGPTTTFHLVIDGVKPWHWSTFRFKPAEVSSLLPFDEFCRRIDAITNAPYGTPTDQIGVQEAVEYGDGEFRPGAAYRLGDPRLVYQQQDGTYVYKTIEQLGWGPNRGEAGQGKPIILALLP